ncbi:MAG: hypothetical protein COA71_06925 [SAR86 cluster bacterium]|uniref:Uncharacterized protein n=1 Tax=SAR86 cluster bacterium TaxID=2030880 RepID=A0A2A5CD20_9GAMM|nr:hypothetical protein [Gammaproteobacteria bacterium AH-315-E17]PCJ41739.1 MAG: hypothetical protein COA71_06925 [SAR86 cluster bacterium]
MKTSIIKATALTVAISASYSALGQDFVGWLDYGEGDAQWQDNKQRLQAFGEEFDNAFDMYEYLERQAGGGDQLSWEDMDRPEFDWSGIYTRTKGGLSFDPDIPSDQTTAQLTEAGAAARQEKIDQLAATGGEYDPISDCRPPGHPRWASEPFLHEFIVTPDQTWLVNEMVNDARRVYTDGRAHTAPEDAYPTWNGDTIGFWDDGVLVTHTAYLNAGQYQRGAQPDYSDQVEVVERWRKVNGILLEADFWVFDPVNLTEPWYSRQSWIELANDDTLLRIRYWWCGENQNNDIIILDDGTSQFSEFDFLDGL